MHGHTFIALVRRYVTHVSFFPPSASFLPVVASDRNGVEPVFFFIYVLSLFADATLLALRTIEFAPIAGVDRVCPSFFEKVPYARKRRIPFANTVSDNR